MSRWVPPERPRWLERLNALGAGAGGADLLVGLDPRELEATATRSVALEDFGEETWRPHYEVLVAALEDEARLHLAGRLLVREELIRSLRNRLLIADAVARDPSITEEPIESPVFVVGTARSGTSILHELLGCDPGSRLPHTWEVLHPVESPDGADRRVVGDREVTLWHDLQPEYRAMHLNGGELPTECIFLTMNQFLSDQWSGCHSVPSYSAHAMGSDHTEAYRFHRRQLQVMQRREGARRWVLKAPSHLATLNALFGVYPDARVMFIHRDPLATIPSTLNLMGTLKWMRSDHVDLDGTIDLLPMGFAMMLESIMQRRREGSLPDAQFVDVRFTDLMDDPSGTVVAACEQLGVELDPSTPRVIADYVDAKPRGKHGRHDYSLEGFGLDLSVERERFRPYTDHFRLLD